VSNNEKSYWFAAKRYGWGWGLPVTWQGWAVIAAYVAALAAGVVYLREHPDARMLPAWIAAITLALVAIIATKGERPLRWRWGDDRDRPR